MGTYALQDPMFYASGVAGLGVVSKQPAKLWGNFHPRFLDQPPPCILGTHHEKGAQTFWSVVNRLPLSGNAVLCWKFCHVFHKLLRDGHSNVSAVPRSQLHEETSYSSAPFRLLTLSLNFVCWN